MKTGIKIRQAIPSIRRSVLILSLFLCVYHMNAQVRAVLFLGNSYTFYNNLPKMVSDIAASNGDSVYFESNTPGGYTLQGHTTNAATLSKIKSRKWDYVVLQEQSQKPSFPPSQVQSDVYPYAKFLDSLITSNDSCTETIFYMTWGRKYGDQQNCSFYTPLCTYAGMQGRLRDSYLQMANDNDAIVAPVGMAFKNSIAADSNLNLYSADNSHPSIYGSYLAACVFYSSIFHKSTVGLFRPSNVPSGTAFFLQNISDITVFDSLQIWRIDTNANIKPSFTYAVSGLTLNFTNTTTTVGAKYLWSFGDGVTSNLKDPSHTYSGAGNYKVNLEVTKNCEQAMIEEDVKINLTGFEKTENQKIIIFPNPSNGSLSLILPEDMENSVLKIRDNLGRIILTSKLNSVGLNSFVIEQKGVYLLSIEKENVIKIKRRIVIN